MNRNYILIPLVVGASAFTSCKQKSTTSSSNSDPANETLLEKVESVVESVTSSSLSAEERAVKLGFAARLPENITTYSSLHNGRKAFDQLMKTDIGSFVLTRMAEEGVTLDELMTNDEAAPQIAMYSEEYFTAYGPGAGDDVEQVMQAYERILFYLANVGVHSADVMLKDVENFNPMQLQAMLMPLSNGPLKNAPSDLINLFAKFNMPAVYQGAKVSNAESRELVLAQMDQGISILSLNEDFSEPIKFTRNDVEFSGYKISGEKLSAEINAEKVEDMSQVFDVKDITAFKETLAKKNLIVVTGVVGDYVLMFLGQSEEDLILVDKPSESFCARAELADLDPYLEKDLLSVNFADGEVTAGLSSVEVIAYRLINAMTDGLRLGFGEAKSMGDLRDVEALLEHLTEQGKALVNMFSSSDQSVVSYIEDGVKVESFGGSNVPSIDFTATHKLSSLEGAAEGTVLFANWTSNEAYNTKVKEYIDTLMEATYMLSSRIAGLAIDVPDFAQFQGGQMMFDQMIRKDLVELSDALRGDMSEGVGAEGAFIIDLNGKLPRVPGLPDQIIEEGKMPRVAFVSTVADRSKLQSAWKRTNVVIENLLSTATKMTGKNIPMQVPMSSEKDGLKTWFVPIPFQNDDFVPSVSVSDELFFVSTSKLYSESLTERVQAGGGESRKGAYMHVDFNLLNQYIGDLFVMVEKNADELMPSDSAREDFIANKEMIQELLKALETMQGMTYHIRQDDGQTRVSLHLSAE
ncbi:MAG: hypothetical protein ACSHX0_07905 [Akkermansiaceae bacterium]